MRIGTRDRRSVTPTIARTERRRATTRGRIAPPATSFVGRKADLNRLARLIADAHGRLVTITGPAGCGKTRLAMEATAPLGSGLNADPAFVDLTAVRDADRVIAEIVRALGFVEMPGHEPAERLAAGLGPQRRLVVLDNFEHVVEAGPAVADIASRCPESVLLVTSRRRLNVIGELTLALGPLAVPAPDPARDTDGLAAIDSVVMFGDRAQAVGSRFTDNDSLVAIGEICRRLDGLPLAIELTAAHTRLLSPAGLLARWDEQARSGALDLRGGTGQAPHHRTMRETVRWSYDLLDEPARQLLRRVSVFNGGWTLDAMATISADGPATDGLFDALVDLVDLHLVEPTGGIAAEPRFRLLETVREFAREQLEGHDELEEAASRHADCFAALARRAGQGLASREQQRWSAIVESELPNFRAALDRLAGAGRWAEGLTAVVALQPYWLDWGPTSEARRWLERFAGGEVDPVLRAAADGWAARMAAESSYVVGGVIGDDVVERLMRARQTLETADDASEWLWATEHTVYVLHRRGELEQAGQMIDDVLARNPSPADNWRRATLLAWRADIARDLGAPDVARARLEETMAVAGQAGHDRARLAATISHAILRLDSMPDARREIQDSFDLATEIGSRRDAAATTAVAGALAISHRDPADAAKWFRACIDLGLLTGIWSFVGWGVMGVANAAKLAGQSIEAARLHGSLAGQLASLRPMTPALILDRYEGHVAAVAAELGEDVFARECKLGEGRAWPDAVEDAKRLADRLIAVPSGAMTAGEPDRRRRRGPRPSLDLTDREREIVRGLVDGQTNKAIAASLGLSAKTVMHHTGRVYRKLGVRGRAEAVAHALREGLVD